MRDEIEKDRAEGTPGPWETFNYDDRCVQVVSGNVVCEALGIDREALANGRRCARVPQLEDAYLAACELADAVVEMMNYQPLEVTPELEEAIAKFRAIK